MLFAPHGQLVYREVPTLPLLYCCQKKGCGGSNVRKERLEELLVNRLGEMSLRAEMLDLVGAVVKDAWKERVNTSEAVQKALTARLRRVVKKRDTPRGRLPGRPWHRPGHLRAPD